MGSSSDGVVKVGKVNPHSASPVSSEEEGSLDPDTHELSLVTEAESRDLRPHAQDSGDYQPPPGAGRKEKGFSLKPSEGARPCRHFDLGLPDASTARQEIAPVLSPLVCGAWFECPKKPTHPVLPYDVITLSVVGK